MSDIIGYIRNNIEVNYIKIERVKNINFEAIANFKYEGIPIEAKSEIKKVNKDILLIDCKDRLLPSEKKRDFYWINEFPGLIEMIDSFSGGEAKRVIENNMNFGLTNKIADLIGVSASFITGYKILIEFKG